MSEVTTQAKPERRKRHQKWKTKGNGRAARVYYEAKPRQGGRFSRAKQAQRIDWLIAIIQQEPEKPICFSGSFFNHFTKFFSKKGKAIKNSGLCS